MLDQIQMIFLCYLQKEISQESIARLYWHFSWVLSDPPNPTGTPLEISQISFDNIETDYPNILEKIDFSSLVCATWWHSRTAPYHFQGLQK